MRYIAHNYLAEAAAAAEADAATPSLFIIVVGFVALLVTIWPCWLRMVILEHWFSSCATMFGVLLICCVDITQPPVAAFCESIMVCGVLLWSCTITVLCITLVSWWPPWCGKHRPCTSPQFSLFIGRSRIPGGKFCVQFFEQNIIPITSSCRTPMPASCWTIWSLN